MQIYNTKLPPTASKLTGAAGGPLLSHISNRAEILVTSPDISVSQIQIRFLCDRYAAMPQDAAQSVDVHSCHDAALCKVISQCMRRYLLLDSRSGYILPEVLLEVAYLQRLSSCFYRKQILSLCISVFES